MPAEAFFSTGVALHLAPRAGLTADTYNVSTMVAFPRGRATFVALAFAVALFSALALPALRPSGLLRDFDAFYCAGTALRADADPYLAEPLGTCERTPKPPPLMSGTRGLAMPAPIPPYALLPFRLLSRLPYETAGAIWTAAGLLCVVITVFALRRLTRLPLTLIALVLCLTDGYASLCLGQIAPVAIAAIAVAGVLLEDYREGLAACAGGVAMIEPHLGLPVCLTMFLFRDRTRLPLVAIAVAFAALSIFASDFTIAREYVTNVLPAHALSEVANEKQFSLTYALFRFGVQPAFALKIGEFWYLGMLAIGLFAARNIARRNGPAAYALVPPALAVIGGPFVHIIQIAATLPAALMLFSFEPGAWRRPLGIAIVLLAIPWIQFANLGTIFIALAAAVAGVLALTLVDERPIAAAIAAGGTIAALEACIALVRPIPDALPVLAARYDPNALAEASWGLYVRTIGTANAAAFDVAKIPTLLGLVVVACATFVEATARGRQTRTHIAIRGKEAATARRTATW